MPRKKSERTLVRERITRDLHALAMISWANIKKQAPAAKWVKIHANQWSCYNYWSDNIVQPSTEGYTHWNYGPTKSLRFSLLADKILEDAHNSPRLGKIEVVCGEPTEEQVDEANLLLGRHGVPEGVQRFQLHFATTVRIAQAWNSDYNASELKAALFSMISQSGKGADSFYHYKAADFLAPLVITHGSRQASFEVSELKDPSKLVERLAKELS